MVATVWEPDDGYTHGRLTKPELRWLASKAQEAPSKSPADARRLHQLASKLQEHVGLACAGIGNATVSSPPPKRSNLGMPRGTDPSDPALAQIESTHHVIDAALTRLGHLFADCPICEDLDAGAGHNDSTPTMLDLTGHDDGLTDLSDHCTGLSATSPHAVATVLAQAPQKATRQADTIVDLWHQARNDGAESDVLRDQIGRLNEVVSRARRVEAMVAQWLPSRVNRCAAGCGGAAPNGGVGTCGRCRTARWRDQAAS